MKAIAVVIAFVALGSAAAVQSPKISYNGYKVVRIPVGTDVSKMTEIVSNLGLKTWKGWPRAGAFTDVVVPPSKVAAFEKETEGMESVTMHDDLGLSIAKESEFDVYSAGSANATWFDSYHSYADHLQFLNDMHASYPSNSEIVTSGTSLQGKAITGIHFWGGSGKGVKPAVVFHGTVHAREWISTMVVEYMVYNLLTKYNSSTEVKGFIDKYDFYIFPVVNPDGFLYTQTGDRMWRKNRQTTTISTCVGHDINRNWPFEWSVAGGASDQPCAEDYRGASQGDAPETKALAAWLQKTKDAQGLKLYIDYHSYSQLFMTPYGYSCSAVAVKNAELQALAKGAVDAIQAVHGVAFQYGPICNTIYPATGTSVDYINDVVKADYTFTSELRDTGRYGFVLPTSEIIPSVEEAYAGVRYLLLNMK